MKSSLPPVWGYKRRAWPAITLKGDDHLDFLQRLSTQHVLNMKAGEVAPAAFLNGNGTVIGLFLLWKQEDSCTLLPEPQSGPAIVAHIHKMHFAERLEVEQQNRDWIEIRGVKSKEFIKSLGSVTVLPAESWGAPGSIARLEEAPANLQLVGDEEYYLERALNLFPRDQVDIGENNIILEAGLLDYVHRNKGCYPGQEVVERIFTYGNVAKKLILLEGHARELERGSELYLNEKKTGNVTSRHPYPRALGAGPDLAGEKSGSYLCVATVFRMSATVGNVFSLGAGQPPQLKVLKVAGDDNVDR